MTKIQKIIKKYRNELNLKYEFLGIAKQPNGNREEWVESDMRMMVDFLEEMTIEGAVKIINTIRRENKIQQIQFWEFRDKD